MNGIICDVNSIVCLLQQDILAGLMKDVETNDDVDDWHDMNDFTFTISFDVHDDDNCLDGCNFWKVTMYFIHDNVQYEQEVFDEDEVGYEFGLGRFRNSSFVEFVQTCVLERIIYNEELPKEIKIVVSDIMSDLDIC